MRRSSAEKALGPLNNRDRGCAVAWWWRGARGNMDSFQASLMFAGIAGE